MWVSSDILEAIGVSGGFRMGDHFTEGQCYTRKTISELLGGNVRDFFPHGKKHVVCGCFRKNLNSGAPSEVLPGISMILKLERSLDILGVPTCL